MLSNSPSVQGAHLIRAATLVSATSVGRLGVDQSVSEASNHRRVISYRPCDPQYTTVAYTAISMLCMAILSGLVGGYITQRRWHALMWPGYRLRQLERKQLKRMRFPHVLLCLLYEFTDAGQSAVSQSGSYLAIMSTYNSSSSLLTISLDFLVIP